MSPFADRDHLKLLKMGSGLHDFDDEPEAPNPLAATKADLEEAIRKMEKAKESAMIARERELSAV